VSSEYRSTLSGNQNRFNESHHVRDYVPDYD
jgi:hypothetical protein